MACAAIGFSSLPDILWRKPTNAPNKFMGSGMLPAGAYVTYEHEYILVLRKGAPRPFAGVEGRALRRESAFFWEERNHWFSDLWSDLRGTGQALGARAAGPGRERSAAFPFELPFRLVQMFSVYGDTVFDPFAGTGTTLHAAASSGRSSVGFELDPELADVARRGLSESVAVGQARVSARLAAHRRFVASRLSDNKSFAHHNLPHDIAVMTAQETSLHLRAPTAVTVDGVCGVADFELEHAVSTTPTRIVLAANFFVEWITCCNLRAAHMRR